MRKRVLMFGSVGFALTISLNEGYGDYRDSISLKLNNGPSFFLRLLAV